MGNKGQPEAFVLHLEKELLRVSVKDSAVAVMFLTLPHWAFLNCMHSLVRDREGEVEISTKSTS